MIVGTLKGQPQQVPQLSKSSNLALQTSISTFEQVMNQIMAGTISLADYEYFQPKLLEAMNLCEISDVMTSRKDDLEQSYQQRSRELDAYSTFIGEFSKFWHRFKSFYKGITSYNFFSSTLELERYNKKIKIVI